MTGAPKESAALVRKSERDGIRLFGTVEIDPFLLRPGFQRWALNILVSLLLALLFLDSDSKAGKGRGYQVGEIADQDIYAVADMLIPDNEATAQRKKEAESGSWKVFYYTPATSKLIESRIHKVFSDFRALYQPEADWIEAEKHRLDVLRRELKQRGGKTVPYVYDDSFPEREAELKTQFNGILKDISPKPFLLSDKHFQALKQDRFSEVTERRLLSSFNKVMEDGVVQTLENLPKKTGEGMTVRALTGVTTDEYKEYPRGDISAIRDLEEARKDIADPAFSPWVRDAARNLRQAIVEIAQQLVVPNYRFDAAATAEKSQQAVSGVEPVYITIKKGQIIVRQGEVITPSLARKLTLINPPESKVPPFIIFLGHFLWIAGFLAIVYAFPARTIRKFKPTVRDLAYLSILLLLLIGALRFVQSLRLDVESWKDLSLMYMVPFVAGALLIRLLLNSESALIFSAALAVLAGIMAESSSLSMFVIIGSLVGANEVGQARTRTAIAKAGLYTGIVNVFVSLTLSLVGGYFLEPRSAYDAFMAGGAGILGGLFALALMPIFESLFGYVSDIRLLELANQEHPLLKALIMNAPGTYQHALMVGTLSEAAAERIHVNPLMAKVMSLYHDIGKMEKPVYYVENQRDGSNPHDRLTPSMSTLIISSHVKYGQELAKMYRLPRVIIDAIPQHHGTTLIKYFYARAKEREDPELQHIEEKDYRYPGPKPQTREAGILMMADSVEATARSLPDPTPAKLKGMVKRIIGGIFNDGQLDECELTLKDINAISEAFTEVLSSIYHSRPEYPTVPRTHGHGGHEESGGKDGGFHLSGDPELKYEAKVENSTPPKKNSLRSPA